MQPGSEEASILVVRAWREAAGFRARVTVRPDASFPEEWAVVLGSPDDVVAVVAEWSSDFAAGRPLRPPRSAR